MTKQSNPRITVLNRDSIELHKISITQPYVVISISGPGDQARPNINEHCLATLYLVFHDADTRLFEDLELFDEEDAQRILEFYKEYKPKVERIIIHCDAGFSRSPAVAAALYKIEGRDDNNWFKHYHPNRRVYSLLLAEYYKGVKDD
jgi:predicted protein tyrosine phosphatase